MTVWTANSKDRLSGFELLPPNTVAYTYRISSVVNGNTGGTLTVSNMDVIDNFSLRGFRDTGPTPLGTLVGYISGKTIVVTHDDPGEGGDIYIKVWGKR